MDQIIRFKKKVLEYLSPQIKRPRIFGPSANISNTDDIFTSPETKSSDKNVDDAPSEKSCENNLPPWTTNPRKRTRQKFEDDSNEDSLSSDDSVLPTTENINIRMDWVCNESKYNEIKVLPSIESKTDSDISDDSQSFRDDESESQASIECEVQERDRIDSEVQEYFDREAELELRKKDVEIAKASGEWHPNEIFLFERLCLRGFEFLLPQSWRIDFPTLPLSLFPEYTDTPTLVNTNFTSSCYGIKALQSILNLGVRVRDNLLTGAPTEKLISREIFNYYKWSEKDGNFAKTRYLPVFVLVVARPKQTIESLSATMENQMRLLAEKHRQMLLAPNITGDGDNGTSTRDFYSRQPPLLYGIIVTSTIIVFVTYDSAKRDASVRHMQHFDFREKGSDAWIGLAVAILIIVARNYIMTIKNEFTIDEPDVDVDL